MLTDDNEETVKMVENAARQTVLGDGKALITGDSGSAWRKGDMEA